LQTQLVQQFTPALRALAAQLHSLKATSPRRGPSHQRAPVAQQPPAPR
jgi:hypothetical protein